jgi:hypothetical protein
VGCEGMVWIDLAQDRDRCQTLVNVVINLQVPCSIIIISSSSSSSSCHLYAVVYSYVPEQANHVHRVYNVAAILLSQLMVHVMLFPIIIILYFYISTF